MLISLVEYAEKVGKSTTPVKRMAREGRFKTCQKIGRNWVIDSDEPYPELTYHTTSGKYVGWRKKYPHKPSDSPNDSESITE